MFLFNFESCQPCHIYYMFYFGQPFLLHFSNFHPVPRCILLLADIRNKHCILIPLNEYHLKLLSRTKDNLWENMIPRFLSYAIRLLYQPISAFHVTISNKHFCSYHFEANLQAGTMSVGKVWLFVFCAVLVATVVSSKQDPGIGKNPFSF